MPDLRRIVPDSSVFLAALFQESAGLDAPRTIRRAEAVCHQIRSNLVLAFAPDHLLTEVMKGCFRVCTERSKQKFFGLGRDDAANAVMEVLKLPIQYVPAIEISATALDLTRTSKIAAPDSWFVACAIYQDAEFWLSHDHRDGLLHNAKAVHNSVYALSDRPFSN